MNSAASAALQMACATHTGTVRKHNEDAVIIAPSYRFAAVADGLGGHQSGDIASKLALKVLSANLVKGESLYASIVKCHTAVTKESQRETRYKGMATTLLAAQFGRQSAQVITMGDSRAYRMRDGELFRLTRDHTVGQAIRDQQNHSKLTRYDHMLTTAIGMEAFCKPSVFTFNYQPSDLFLLCTDGLSDTLNDTQIAVALQASKSMPLEFRVKELLNSALAAKARDNVSLCLIQQKQHD